MLRFARAQVGKPFSMLGMARSVVLPRKTTGDSWYCAELVAAALMAGGVIASDYNAGAATPENLHQMLRHSCAGTANPVVLRKMQRQQQCRAAHNPRHLLPYVPRPLAMGQMGTTEEMRPLLQKRVELAARQIANSSAPKRAEPQIDTARSIRLAVARSGVLEQFK